MSKKNNLLLSDVEIKTIQNWIPLDFKFGSWNNCFYCGELPDSQDHVIPWSMMYSIEKHKGSDKGPRTPACSYCNNILNSFFFDTLHERCEYIKKHFYKKNIKLLKIQDWTKEELNQLQGKLKNHVINQMNLKKQIEPRVFWQNSKEFIIQFENAYEKCRLEYPTNQNFHNFMMPHWYFQKNNIQIAA